MTAEASPEVALAVTAKADANKLQDDGENDAKRGSTSVSESPPIVTSSSEHAVKQKSSPSASASSSSGLFLFVQIFISLIFGATGGAYLTANLLESEYQHIVSKLQSNHQSSILHTKTEHINCQSHLSDEKRTNEEEVSKLRIHFDHNERSFQQKVEQYAKEVNATYATANEGLTKASIQLQIEAEQHESTKLRLAKANEQLKVKEEQHESTQLQLAQATKRQKATHNTWTESTRALEAAENEKKDLHSYIERLKSELDEAFDELDRRDLERAECDDHHRNMLTCRESLKEALVDLANQGDDGATQSSKNEQMKQMATQLDHVMQEKHEVHQHLLNLIEEGKKTHELIEDITLKSLAMERERDVWEGKMKVMMEKIDFRNRKEVLDEYGPGPYYVKLTFTFQSPPEHESIILELAPLDLMPHTIHTFLELAEKQAYNDSTFFLVRNHILVGGPINFHDEAGNLELEAKMTQEGYFPHGALLFRQYTSEYPHEQYTIGFNHVGGPVFYVNLDDNTNLHGPQESSDKEGDPCFAKIVEGFDVVRRIALMPRAGNDSLESVVYISQSEVMELAE